MKPFELKRALKPGWGAVILLVAVMAAVWWWLGRLEGEVAWLQVEAPPQAVAGGLLPMRVRVTGLTETSRLCVDLHWTNSRDDSNGFLASGGTRPVGKEGGQFDFEILVRVTDGLRYVKGIIYLSPTGSWDDHTFVAATDLIPVTDGRVGGQPTLVRLPVRQLFEARPRENGRPTELLGLMTGLLWLAASVVAGMVFHSYFRSHEKPAASWWLALTAGLVLACLWELFGLESRMGSLARVWAHAEDVYYRRAWFQKGMISIAIAATLVLLACRWRQRWSHQRALIWFSLYLAIAFVNLLSFHPVDQVTGLSWHGITLVGALKLVCAVATLEGVWQAKQAPSP